MRSTKLQLAAYKSVRIFGLAERLSTIEGMQDVNPKRSFPVSGAPVKYIFSLRKMSLVIIPDTDRSVLIRSRQSTTVFVCSA